MRAVPALLILALLLPVVSSLDLPLATGGVEGQLLYVATDSYDEMFVRDLVEKYPSLAGPVIGIDGLISLSNGLEGTIVVLLDPNWDDALQVLEVLEILREHLYNGGLIVSTLNGAVLLSRLLEDHGVALRVSESSEGFEAALPGYEYEKYKVAVLEGAGVGIVELQGQAPLYRVTIGNGFVVILPFNVVWAYGDLGHEAYLKLFSAILDYAGSLEPSSPAEVAPLASALAVSATVAAGYIALTLSPEEARRPIMVPLRIRTAERNALGHPVRRKILRLLGERGYLYFNELWRELGTSKATLSWHLDVLYRAGLIGYLKYKKYMLYYIATPAALRALAEDLALRDPDVCRILQLLEKGLDASSISGELGLSVETVSSIAALLSSYKPGLCASPER
ncbi:MAG: winged helix-turn-helix domain-containing protein [Desulfurococcales archaeon]|nr:winged helix-turn-helix domain-containing protein [Desulfurococcales archaeon]